MTYDLNLIFKISKSQTQMGDRDNAEFVRRYFGVAGKLAAGLAADVAQDLIGDTIGEYIAGNSEQTPQRKNVGPSTIISATKRARYSLPSDTQGGFSTGGYYASKWLTKKRHFSNAARQRRRRTV